MSMSLKSPLTKFIGSQRSPKIVKPSKVPFRESSRATSASLGERKRKQLETILEKEKNKERRERVAYVLSQKLIAKFGVNFTSVITFFVEEFFNSHEEITGSELTILEREIHGAIKAKIASQRNTARDESNTKNAAHGTSQTSDPTTTQNNGGGEGGVPSRPPSGKEWQLIQVYQAVMDEEKDKQERINLAHKKMAFRQILDEQRNQAKNVNSKENEDERRYVEHIMTDIEKYHLEEQQKKEQHRLKYEAELKFRRAQIEDQHRRLAEEKAALRRMEIQNLQMAEEQGQREVMATQLEKQRQVENMERIKKENEENKRLRAIEKAKEAVEDHHLMQEYAAKLDREASEREHAFAVRMKKMEISGQKFANEGAGKALREDQIRFEQQLLREQARKAESDHRAEVLKDEQRRQKLQAALEENRRQLMKRKLSVEEERRRDAELAEQFRRDMEEFYQQEEAKRRRYREKQLEYRRILDGQIEELKKFDSKLQNITNDERKINKDTLTAIASPQVMSKLMHRMRMNAGQENKKQRPQASTLSIK